MTSAVVGWLIVVAWSSCVLMCLFGWHRIILPFALWTTERARQLRDFRRFETALRGPISEEARERLSEAVADGQGVIRSGTGGAV